MITPLRRRHRWLAPGAMAAALLGLGVALAARPSEHVARARGGAVVDADLPAGAVVLAERAGYAVAATAAPAPRLWLLPRTALDAPDLLVYRVDGVLRADGTPGLVGNDGLVGEDGAPGEGGAPPAGRGDVAGLPAGATLLGPASPTAPTSFAWAPGPAALVLYSLGHRRRVDVVQLGAVPEEGR